MSLRNCFINRKYLNVLTKNYCAIPECASEDGDANSGSAVPAQAPRVTSPKQGSSRVLTDAVIQLQRDHVEAIREVARELKEIKHELSSLNANIEEYMKK